MKQTRHLATSVVAAIILSVGLAKSASADVLINFDDLTDGGGGTPISNGYQGFDWNNFYVLNTVDFFTSAGTNGYTNGTVSSPNVAYNGGGTAASITSTTSFTFNSAYFTAAWNNGLSITVAGLLSGVTEDSTTFTVDTTGPTLETFNWTNIDELDFSSSGGTNAGYAGSGTHFAMDNMTLDAVPEPEPLVLLGTGLALLFGCVRRRSVS